MSQNRVRPAPPSFSASENIAYVRQMLGELRKICQNEGADMLSYLIEMAYLEAGEIQAGIKPLSVRREGNPSAGMPVQAARKIKL
nr:hypothetical protein [Shinella daejeonensis]